MGMRLGARGRGGSVGWKVCQQRVWREEVLAGHSLDWQHQHETTDSILAENTDPRSAASPEECSIFRDPINKLLQSDKISNILWTVKVRRVNCNFICAPVCRFV